MRTTATTATAEMRAASGLPDADYTDAFTLATPLDRTPEQWARAIFEQASPATRTFLVVGWRTALLAAVDPRPAEGHVLGWRIVTATQDTAVLHLATPLLASRLVLRVEPGTVVFSTHVRYRHRAAAAVWAVVGVVHRQTIPRLLDRAGQPGRSTEPPHQDRSQRS